MKKFVEVLADKEALIKRSLTIITEKIESAISQRGLCTIALSGGSTPKPVYEGIAKLSLPWEKIHVFWGDERYVAADHPESNQRMARQAWLDSVNIPGSNIHAMPTTKGDPKIDAQKYEDHLRDFFDISSQEEIPVLDVILLGMGDDGHTASLFPHTEALLVRDRLVTVGNKDGTPRLTFSVPLINSGRCIIFIVAGASKQEALAQIFAPSGDEMTYPARLIQPQGELWWLLDSSAGVNLNNHS